MATTYKYAALKDFKFPKMPSGINLAYSKSIVPSYTEREYALGHQIPRKLKVEHELNNTPRDRLYWGFVTATSKSSLPLSTMRNHYERRWKEAFVQALKKNGYDARGTGLAMDAEKLSTRPDLRGTLEIRLFKAMCWEDKDSSNMFRYSDAIVQKLVGMMQETNLPRRIYG